MKLSSMVLTDGSIDGFDYASGSITIRVRDYADAPFMIEIEGVTAINVAGSIIGYRIEKYALNRNGEINVLEFLDEDECRLNVSFSRNGLIKVTPISSVT